MKTCIAMRSNGPQKQVSYIILGMVVNADAKVDAFEKRMRMDGHRQSVTVNGLMSWVNSFAK